MEQYNPKNPDSFKQVELPEPPPIPLNIVPLAQGLSTVKEGAFQSKNFRTSRAGYRLSETLLEAYKAKISGTFILGGTLITVDNISELQDTIDLLESQGGGIVSLVPDTYSANNSFTIPSGVEVDLNGAVIDFGGGAFQFLIEGSNAYTTGTVDATNDSPTLTGHGTNWTVAMEGRSILIGELWYVIQTVNSTTSITLESDYIGSTVVTTTYVIATTIDGARLKNGTLQNSSIALVKFRYCNDFTVDGIFAINGLIGFDGDDTSIYGLLNFGTDSCGTGFTLNNCRYGTMFNWNVFSSTINGAVLTDVSNTGFEIFSFQNNVGTGLSLINCDNNGFEDFAVFETTGVGISIGSGCTGDSFSDGTVTRSGSSGITFTDVSKCQFSMVDVDSSGGKGVEFISGNSDIGFALCTIDGSTLDGVKLTATTDRVSLIGLSIINSGGYGINIADSTCDNNQIISPAFSNNTLGKINDQGTSTFVSPGIPKYFYSEAPIPSSGALMYTDDINYIPGMEASNNYFKIIGGPSRYQSRTVTSDWAQADLVRSIVKLGAYVYVLIVDSGTAPDTYRIYRYDKDNLAGGGTLMTFSGTAPNFSTDRSLLLACDGNKFYVNYDGGNSANAYVLAKYTVSGTVFTYSASVTCGAATLGFDAAFGVLSSGNIYTFVDANDAITKFNSSGTLQYTDAAGSLVSSLGGMHVFEDTIFFTTGQTFVKVHYSN